MVGRLLAGLLLVVVVVCGSARPVAPDRPAEDSPGAWDCRTMGNRVCGPVLGGS